MVASSAEEGEQRILDTYEPAPVHESDSDLDGTPNIPVIPYHGALESVETPRLTRPQIPTLICRIVSSRGYSI